MQQVINAYVGRHLVQNARNKQPDAVVQISLHLCIVHRHEEWKRVVAKRFAFAAGFARLTVTLVQRRFCCSTCCHYRHQLNLALMQQETVSRAARHANGSGVVKDLSSVLRVVFEVPRCSREHEGFQYQKCLFSLSIDSFDYKLNHMCG
jgi:hypothetical protein